MTSSASRPWMALALCGFLAGTSPLAHAEFRQASPAEKAEDAQAFAEVQQALEQRLTDVESVVVAGRGRVLYEFHRDGEPGRLRNVQSVEKSALSALVGIALAQGHLAGLDQAVLALMPEWAPLNADPRTRDITLRHLLTLTAGFDLGNAVSNTGKQPPAQGWARPLAAAPGERFAYDNALVPILGAVLEKATGMPLADYARQHLVAPLGMAEPSYRPMLHLRTIDMAKLGQLFLDEGRWQGRQVLPAEFVKAATRPQAAGGPPVGMPYGYLWWIVPPEAPRRTFLASGYAGQMIWVHPSADLVVAMTSTVSAESQRRGQAVQLLRGLVPVAERRAGTPAR